MEPKEKVLTRKYQISLESIVKYFNIKGKIRYGYVSIHNGTLLLETEDPKDDKEEE